MDNKNNEAVDGVVASEEISLEEQQAVLENLIRNLIPEMSPVLQRDLSSGMPLLWRYSTSTHLSLDFGLQFARGPCTCCL